MCKTSHPHVSYTDGRSEFRYSSSRTEISIPNWLVEAPVETQKMAIYRWAANI